MGQRDTQVFLRQAGHRQCRLKPGLSRAPMGWSTEPSFGGCSWYNSCCVAILHERQNNTPHVSLKIPIVFSTTWKNHHSSCDTLFFADEKAIMAHPFPRCFCYDPSEAQLVFDALTTGQRRATAALSALRLLTPRS